LRDTTEEMGCVRAIPGSHKQGPIKHLGEAPFYLDMEEYPIDSATAVPAKRGDILMFNYLTIHGSNINASDKVRKTVLIQARAAEDEPTVLRHNKNNAQGMVLHGVLPDPKPTVAPPTAAEPEKEKAAMM